MSSEDSRTSSTSSRLSQFGIYRSIDARTEEFLRLSRKRQIRQGCACAAVSTAVTVTIVITVLLIYEYTMNLDSNPAVKSRMSAWHGMFNDSSPFEVKYKSKVNLDPTTLKLLPLILKSLNHNRNFEKLIENTSSAAPVNENINMDNSFQTKVIQRSPLKSTYGIHKTEFTIPHPIGYKNTFNNLDYYKKIRQANDHQRMLNYFDKMINLNNFDISASSSLEFTERLSTERNRQTLPFFIEKRKRTDKINNTKISRHASKFNKLSKSNNTRRKHTMKPAAKEYRDTISLPKIERNLNLSEFIKPRYKTAVLNRNQRLSDVKLSKKTCECSKILGDLLSKLLTDIYNILPKLELYKMSCNKNNDDGPKTSTQKPTAATSVNPIKTSINILQKVDSKPKQNVLNINTAAYYIEDIANKTANHNINLRNKIDFKSNIENKTNIYVTTTIKAYIEPTYTTQALIGVNTKPMHKMKNKNIWSNKIDKIFQKLYSKSTSTTTRTPYTNKAIRNGIRLQKGDDFKENRESFGPVADGDSLSHEHDNIYIFPLLGILEKSDAQKEERGKQNTTSIIDWQNILRREKKKEYNYHSNTKGDLHNVRIMQETTTKPAKVLKNIFLKGNNKHKAKENPITNNIMYKYLDYKNISQTKNQKVDKKKTIELKKNPIWYNKIDMSNENEDDLNISHTKNMKGDKINNIESNITPILYNNSSNRYQDVHNVSQSKNVKESNRNITIPKVKQNFNTINEIYMYQDGKNVSKTKNVTFPVFYEEDQILNKSETEKLKGNQSLKTLKASPINKWELKTKSTESGSNKDKTKRNSLIENQKPDMHNFRQKHYQQEIEPNSKNKNKIISTSTFTPVLINIETKTSSVPLKSKKNKGPLESLTGIFSKSNNLTHQSKDISNGTIYETFNFRNYINLTDENDTLGSLEYDEFKFMNDEVQEREVKRTITDKYENFQSNKYAKDIYSEDVTKFDNSMIPIGTYIPVFLEIQRNDFNHDISALDHNQDYENNDNFK